MRTIWAAVIATFAGAGAALADNPEPLHSPRPSSPYLPLLLPPTDPAPGTSEPLQRPRPTSTGADSETIRPARSTSSPAPVSHATAGPVAVPAPHGGCAGGAEYPCLDKVVSFLTYWPKPRGVNCYNWCEPLYPPGYAFFPPCIEGSGPAGHGCASCKGKALHPRAGVPAGTGVAHVLSATLRPVARAGCAVSAEAKCKSVGWNGVGLGLWGNWFGRCCTAQHIQVVD